MSFLGRLRSPDVLVPLVLAAITVLVRVPGLYSAMFMDEVHILRAVSHFVSHRTAVPPWFEWPPLFAYVSLPLIGIESYVGGWFHGVSPREWALVAADFQDRALLVLPRLLSVAASVWAVESVRRAGLALWLPKELAVLAGLFVALSPVAIRYGSYGLPDMLMLACVASCLQHVLAGGFLSSGRRPWAVAGVLVGLAAAFKFHGVYAALPVAVAALARPHLSLSRRMTHLTMAATYSLITFVVFAPTFLMTPDQAWGGVRWLLGNVARPRLGPNPIPYIGTSGWLALHEPLLVAGLAAGVLETVRRFQKSATAVIIGRFPQIIALSIVPFFVWLTVGGMPRFDTNYWLPALPGTALLLAVTLHRLPNPARRFITVVLLTTSLGTAVITEQMPTGIDNRLRAAEFLRDQPPLGTVLRVGGYTPKVWGPEDLATSKTIHGPGELGPSAWYKLEFDKRGVAARELLEIGEGETSATAALASLSTGSLVILSGEISDRVLLHPPPKGAEARHSQWMAFLRALHDQRQFRRVFTADRWGAPSVAIYRRK